MAPSHLALNDLYMSKSRSLKFGGLISCKGAESTNMLLSSSIYGEPKIRLGLESH